MSKPVPLARQVASAAGNRPGHGGEGARPHHVALWQQLQQVAVLVQAVQSGGSATSALEQAPAALRPGVQALGHEVLRGLGVGRWLRARLVRRQPAPLLDALLLSALVLAWRVGAARPAGTGDAHVAEDATRAGATTTNAHYTDFTLVSQAVEAAKRHPKLRQQAGLVNAVLRRLVRERADWQTRCAAESPQGQPDLLNVPGWWWQQLQQDHGSAAAGIVQQGLQQAPLTLRVNARHLSSQMYLQQHLEPAGWQGALNGVHGITLSSSAAVQQLPGFAQGWVSVQDAAAQLAAPLLLQALKALEARGRSADQFPDQSPAQPLRLLDACAAPGGKTAHLLELANCTLTALDVDAGRCQRIHENLQRLGLRAQVLAADAAEPSGWWDGALYDGILLDAPCTASGIVRRHPDVPWLRRPQDVVQLAAQQKRLLEALWPLLRPGGVLLYCTCSVFRAEGDGQIEAFLLRHTNAHRLPAPGHLLPLRQVVGDGLGHNKPVALHAGSLPLIDHDGFYYALLAKRSC